MLVNWLMTIDPVLIGVVCIDDRYIDFKGNDYWLVYVVVEL